MKLTPFETEKTQRSTTTNTHPKKCSPIILDNELKCVCLNARSIINKKSELDFLVADIDPHVIGITESWANEDIVDAELALTGYVMFRKDRQERRGGGVILYVKESIQAYEITLKSEADSVEAIWCNIVTRNLTLTIGVVYVLDLILSSQNELVDNVKVHEPQVTITKSILI